MCWPPLNHEENLPIPFHWCATHRAIKLTSVQHTAQSISPVCNTPGKSDNKSAGLHFYWGLGGGADELNFINQIYFILVSIWTYNTCYLLQMRDSEFQYLFNFLCYRTHHSIKVHSCCSDDFSLHPVNTHLTILKS